MDKIPTFPRPLTDCAECQPSDLVKDDVIAQKLWDVSMGMVGPIDAIPVRSDCPPWHPPPVQTAEVVKDAAEVELLQFEDQSVEVAAKRASKKLWRKNCRPPRPPLLPPCYRRKILQLKRSQLLPTWRSS